MSRGPGPGSLTWKNMVAHHQQSHQPGATDWSCLCSWICQIRFNFRDWLECIRVMGLVTLREMPSTISSLVALLVLISGLPTNELRVATNALERILIDYDSVTMSKNALGICYESSTIFRIGEFVAKFWTVQIFWSRFPIGLRIARTDYGVYDSVIIKIFANWVHLSPRIQIFINSWDSGPVLNRGIKQYFLHILSLETDKNLSWISGRWRMNVLVYICFHDQSPGNNRLWLGRNGTHEPLVNSWDCLRLSYGTPKKYTLIWILPIAWRCTTGLISVVDAYIAPMNPYQPLPFQISDRVLDSEPRGCWFEPHRRYCVVSLSKAHLSLLNTGSTQEDPSRHSWKIVDCDIKNQIKQTSKSYHSTAYLMLSRKLIHVCSNIFDIVEEDKANEEVF